MPDRVSKDTARSTSSMTPTSSCCEWTVWRGKEKGMITVTEEAKERFLNVDYPDDTVLSLDSVVDQNTGMTEIGISVSEPMSDDQVVEHDGEAVLHIAGPVSEALDGSTLDAVNTPEGPGIGISTPDSTPLTDDS